jgi:hypothetical protein
MSAEIAEVPALRATQAPAPSPSSRPAAVKGLTESIAACSRSTSGGSGRRASSSAAIRSRQVPPDGIATRSPTRSRDAGPTAITSPAPSMPIGAG